MTGNNAVRSRRSLSPLIRVSLRVWVKTYRAAIATARPLADLLIRLFVAQYFLRSGLVKFGNWDTALALAKYEYPVSWMSPETAALVGVTIELAGPVLLVLGLLTRPAAFAMAALLVVSQIVYLPITTNLFLIALLGWYVWHGVGAISLDRAVAAGIARSALPLARPIAGFTRWLTAHMAPIWLLVVRLWLAASIIVAMGWVEPPVWLATWLPSTQFAQIPAPLALLLAAMLVLGLLVPLAALLLAITVGAMAAMGLHPDIFFHAALLLLLLGLWGAGAVAADGQITDWLERSILFDRPASPPPADWPHVVVVGGGFGG
ncbi:MAG: DoxX family membrane protein, partial [Novosphingobium sp.]|nr:DoxX family membrane protein [Novosphingobium sp.]